MIEFKLVSCEFSGPVQRMVGAGPIVIQLTCKFDVGGKQYSVPGIALSGSEQESEIGERVNQAIITAERNLRNLLERNALIPKGNEIIHELMRKAADPMAAELTASKLEDKSEEDVEKLKSVLLGLPNEKQLKEVQGMYDNLGWGRFVPDGWDMVTVQALIIELKQLLTKFEVK